MGKLYEALCPVCGRTIPEKKITKRKKYYFEENEHENYFTRMDRLWDQDKGFWGLIRQTGGGRGAGLPIIGYLEQPEDYPEFFGQLQEAMLRAIRYYLTRGWIQPEQIKVLLEKYRDE